jgi:peptidoglycan/xylan/chitin deacetylase (PgdA/CDA1 family)
MKSLMFVVLFVCFSAGPASEAKGQMKPAPHREVAVTVDDLPASGDLKAMRGITTRLLHSLSVNKIPAIGFVNESKLYVNGKLDARATALLRLWLDAGHELGNHTYSHASPDRLSLADYEGDVIRGETVTRMLLSERGMKLRYFRHPLLHTGPTVAYKQGLDAFVLSRGYTHATELNADYFDQLAGMVRRRGYSFITLEAALKDKAYSLPEAQSQTRLSWIHRWRLAQGLQLKSEPREPEFVTRAYQELTGFH